MNTLNLHCKKIYRRSKAKIAKMMFPLRNDVTVECDVVQSKSNTNFCKIVKAGALFLAIVFLFLLLSALTSNEFQEEIHSQPPSPQPAAPCEVIELGEKHKEEIKAWIHKEVQANANACMRASKINPEQMRSIIKDEIKRQQKIQLKPDFASASAGGMILDASPTWTDGYSYIYFLFIPIRSTAPPPSIVLEPTRQAGDCWPMEGRKGTILIQLAARANIVGFTMEHIDPAMSLSGGTPEAPNNFSVYGLEHFQDGNKKHYFGTYSYDNKNDEENQYFRVQNINRKSFLYILLEILSNHGNDKYTCIYRFQVHGFIDRANHCA